MYQRNVNTAAHGIHAVPAAFAYEPAAHGVHIDAPAADIQPAEQLAHATLPVVQEGTSVFVTTNELTSEGGVFASIT